MRYPTLGTFQRSVGGILSSAAGQTIYYWSCIYRSLVNACLQLPYDDRRLLNTFETLPSGEEKNGTISGFSKLHSNNLCSHVRDKSLNAYCSLDHVFTFVSWQSSSLKLAKVVISTRNHNVSLTLTKAFWCQNISPDLNNSAVRLQNGFLWGFFYLFLFIFFFLFAIFLWRLATQKNVAPSEHDRKKKSLYVSDAEAPRWANQGTVTNDKSSHPLLFSENID